MTLEEILLSIDPRMTRLRHAGRDLFSLEIFTSELAFRTMATVVEDHVLALRGHEPIAVELAATVFDSIRELPPVDSARVSLGGAPSALTPFPLLVAVPPPVARLFPEAPALDCVTYWLVPAHRGEMWGDEDECRLEREVCLRVNSFMDWSRQPKPQLRLMVENRKGYRTTPAGVFVPTPLDGCEATVMDLPADGKSEVRVQNADGHLLSIRRERSGFVFQAGAEVSTRQSGEVGPALRSFGSNVQTMEHEVGVFPSEGPQSVERAKSAPAKKASPKRTPAKKTKKASSTAKESPKRRR